MTFRYDPIANQKDFQKPSTYDAWHNIVKGFFDLELQDLTQSDIKYPQFYSEVYTPTPNPKNKTIAWNAFPKIVQSRHGGQINDAALQDCATVVDGYRQNYDEYCELFIQKDTNGNVIRIDVTAEPPEYYDCLHDNEPDTLLKLYHIYVNPNVTLDDLQAKADDVIAYLNKVAPRYHWTLDDFGWKSGQIVYNYYNKWNTTDGAMHLHQVNNSLGAEIDIAAQATPLRSKNGQIIRDSTELIECAQYGSAGRNSDPNIGFTINTLCFDGLRVTVHNPVGLYIKNVNFDAITRGGQHVDNIGDYLKMVRGEPQFGLRYRFEIPAGQSGTLNDFEIGGIPIKYGTELLTIIQIGIIGDAVDAEHGRNPPLPYCGRLPPQTLHASAQPTALHATNDTTEQSEQHKPLAKIVAKKIHKRNL